jgi:AcrR family transcriptional regulator
MAESSEARRPPRTRKPRGSLSPDAILDAAERLAADDGFEAVSIRAVAGELAAAPMALYRHFATKDALVDALLDRVLARFEPNPPTRSWREDLRTFAREHRRLLAEHPWAVVPLFTSPNPGIGATRIGEVAFAILRRARLDDEQVVATFSGLIALNYGWSSFAVMRTRTSAADMEAAMASVTLEAFPNTVRLAAEMADYASDRHYERVLDQFVAGVGRTARARPA